jgi:pimeloyl-ACP methyl ester carboxylesterase
MSGQRIRVNIPVTVTDLGTQTVAGWLAVPDQPHDNSLQLLVHGNSYSHLYWDFPYKPEIYSYVEFALAAGAATLAIDQLGVGESSRPPGDRVTCHALAEAVHGVVQAAKGDGLAGHRFERVALVGHSGGSLTSGLEAATYQDVDAVVLTGMLGPNVSGITDNDPRIAGAFVPAASDPVLAGKPGLEDPSYLTLLPEVRVPLFYRQPPAEPELIALDESLKEIMTTGQSATLGTAAEACGQIRCPTLVVNGRYDRFFYDPATEDDISANIALAQAAAADNYTFVPLFDDMGHNLNQHPGAPEVYWAIQQWLHAQDPQSSDSTPHEDAEVEPLAGP